jgi:hypothetical protein
MEKKVECVCKWKRMFAQEPTVVFELTLMLGFNPLFPMTLNELVSNHLESQGNRQSSRNKRTNKAKQKKANKGKVIKSQVSLNLKIP